MFWNAYRSHIRQVVLPGPPGILKDLSYWRNEIFLTILIFLAPLSILALVPSVIMAFLNGVPVVGIADMIAFGLVVLIMLNPRMSLGFRKSIFICIIYGLSVVLLFYVSRPGPGLLFLLAATIFSSVISSSLVARYSAWINTLTCIFVGVLIYSGTDIPIAANYDTGTWIAVSSNLVLLSFVFAECINFLLKGLKTSLDDSKKLEANLTSILESTDAYVYSLDRDYTYMSFNQALKKRMLETYHVEVKHGDKVFGFLAKDEPDEAHFWRNIYTEALAGKALKFEKDFAFDGHHSTTAFSVNPIVEAGQVIGLSCFAADISDLKKAHVVIQELSNGLEVKVAARTAELAIANSELTFQNNEKAKRAAELVTANEELAFQGEEKAKRAAELAIANEELTFQGKEKAKRAVELNAINEELRVARDEVRKHNDGLEQKVAKRTTQYAFLSQINQSIVHIKDERTLFRNACRVAFEIGKFKIAWIGGIDWEN